jgi:predicted transcriptional regulator
METRVLSADVPLPLAERLDRLAERLEFPTDAIVQEALDA